MIIGVLASGNGNSFHALARACADGTVDATIGVVISNNTNAPVLAAAQELGIPAALINAARFDDPDAEILATLKRHRCDWVLLSGYMKKIAPETIKAYADRMVNTHPSLLPKFGQQGMYGIHVHNAVIAAGERRSGMSLHYVNEEYDSGEIIMQLTLTLDAHETPESLEKRVKLLEQKAVVDFFKQQSRGQ